jgi:transcriptional regulator with PAS, ATPase and Fis domain
MTNYTWPGNVRELKNLVERFVVLEDAEVIAPEHMPKWIFGDNLGTGQITCDKISLPDSGLSLEEVEKDLIRQALEKSNSNKTMAAKLLDISYDTLRYQVKKYGLE